MNLSPALQATTLVRTHRPCSRGKKLAGEEDRTALRLIVVNEIKRALVEELLEMIVQNVLFVVTASRVEG